MVPPVAPPCSSEYCRCFCFAPGQVLNHRASSIKQENLLEELKKSKRWWMKDKTISRYGQRARTCNKRTDAKWHASCSVSGVLFMFVLQWRDKQKGAEPKNNSKSVATTWAKKSSSEVELEASQAISSSRTASLDCFVWGQKMFWHRASTKRTRRQTT